MFTVYILLCNDNSFYVGQTNNLTLRLRQHSKGKCISTKNKRPIELVYYMDFCTRVQALKREKEIKSLTRFEKKNLVRKWLND